MNNRKYAAFNGGRNEGKDENRKLLINILELIDVLNDIDANGCDVYITDHEDVLHFKCDFEIVS